MEMISSSELNSLHRRCNQFVSRNIGCSSSPYDCHNLAVDFNSRQGQSVFFDTIV
ncbi:hypothetical protein ALC56_10167 [Trachymyrmex septentrionalis]|uniref:Uncharacterized protein n=1 Tax=Trachymyrmex septentrionalis TaxID=34720 RepID=A0A195F605_9HYME|nr:hypothetical protein ALC56_10167 [Trachymyrmex septentrionalis]